MLEAKDVRTDEKSNKSSCAQPHWFAVQLVGMVSGIEQDDTKDKLAEKWPCASCAIFLGIFHLVAAISLLVFDVATNATTSARFAVFLPLFFHLCHTLIYCGQTCGQGSPNTALLFFIAFLFPVLNCFRGKLKTSQQILPQRSPTSYSSYHAKL
uniref:Uncharacterized protein n=1 Tax=Ditylenchus dipsaci TaxID=166011 RepID=A0A915D6L0_9BILA